MERGEPSGCFVELRVLHAAAPLLARRAGGRVNGAVGAEPTESKVGAARIPLHGRDRRLHFFDLIPSQGRRKALGSCRRPRARCENRGDGKQRDAAKTWSHLSF